MDPPAGIVGWLIVDDRGRHALRLDQAAALQYAAEHRGVVWPVGVVREGLGAAPIGVGAVPELLPRADLTSGGVPLNYGGGAALTPGDPLGDLP